MPSAAEVIAQAFHEAYERRAPEFGYETSKESAVPWADVPEQNKALMIAVAAELIALGVIADPEHVAYLRERDDVLEALEAAGVDNWEGYDMAFTDWDE